MTPRLPRNLVRRHPERGCYDHATINAIIDEAHYCHIAVVRHGCPVIIPTLHVRIEDTWYVHGAVAAGFKDLAQDQPVSVAVTIMDGLVLARSLYNHSANYRSVVAFGIPREVRGRDDKMTVLKAMADRITPGRLQDAGVPNAVEIRRTRVFAIPLDQTSAKIRSGPPRDDPEDLDRPAWAGVLPLTLTMGAPVPDPAQIPPISLPEYLNDHLTRDE